jgi:uncharacterized Ntn-hydrolase superfamily protein
MRKTGKEMASEMTDFVNTFSSDSKKEFVQAMANEHRTLQQSFTRLCLEWIEHCASQEYRTDGRNESSHQVCKAMVQAYKEKQEHLLPLSAYLPLI